MILNSDSKLKNYPINSKVTCCVLSLYFLLALPASNNYMLKSYELDGSGGVGESANYKAETDTAPLAGEQKSSNYTIGGGLIFSQQANVATATLVNSSNWYNKLLLTLNNQNNPADTVFAIAITSDDWVTTNYVQSDGTIGASLGSEDWQTYTNWGGGSGEYVIGLTPDEDYEVKVKARQGDFTESPWGPEAAGSTDPVTLSFDLDIGDESSDETNAPYNIVLGSLTPGAVTTASTQIWVDLETNAENGGYVYIYDAYAGLKSSNVNYTISSSSSNLTGATEGYGLQVATVSNLTAVTPYDGASETVGVVDSTIRTILSSSNAPVTGGRSSILVKAKSATQTPAANDYVDTLTMIASGSF
jgi:hypothetical protein